MKILIVEDEVRLAEALGQIMKEQHYQADIVYNGTDGIFQRRGTEAGRIPSSAIHRKTGRSTDLGDWQ